MAKTNSKFARLALTLGRLILGAVLLYAVFAKLNYPPGNFFAFKLYNWQLAIELFAIAVNGYQVLPDWAVTPVAYGVIILETILGVLLISGVLLRWAAAAATGLLGFFFALMFRAYLLGQSIDCGCFGPGDKLGPESLIRDGILLLLAVLVTWGAFRLRKRAAPATAAVAASNAAPVPGIE